MHQVLLGGCVITIFKMSVEFKKPTCSFGPFVVSRLLATCICCSVGAIELAPVVAI